MLHSKRSFAICIKKKPRKKRTKINVPAGKSVTNLEENFVEQSEETNDVEEISEREDHVEAGPSTSSSNKSNPANSKRKK